MHQWGLVLSLVLLLLWGSLQMGWDLALPHSSAPWLEVKVEEVPGLILFHHSRVDGKIDSRFNPELSAVFFSNFLAAS